MSLCQYTYIERCSLKISLHPSIVWVCPTPRSSLFALSVGFEPFPYVKPIKREHITSPRWRVSPPICQHILQYIDISDFCFIFFFFRGTSVRTRITDESGTTDHWSVPAGTLTSATWSGYGLVIKCILLFLNENAYYLVQWQERKARVEHGIDQKVMLGTVGSIIDVTIKHFTEKHRPL